MKSNSKPLDTKDFHQTNRKNDYSDEESVINELETKERALEESDHESQHSTNSSSLSNQFKSDSQDIQLKKMSMDKLLDLKELNNINSNLSQQIEQQKNCLNWIEQNEELLKTVKNDKISHFQIAKIGTFKFQSEFFALLIVKSIDNIPIDENEEELYLKYKQIIKKLESSQDKLKVTIDKLNQESKTKITSKNPTKSKTVDKSKTKPADSQKIADSEWANSDEQEEEDEDALMLKQQTQTSPKRSRDQLMDMDDPDQQDDEQDSQNDMRDAEEDEEDEEDEETKEAEDALKNESKRLITNKIKDNKGLGRRTAKDKKNARIKHKNKFEKKMKQHVQRVGYRDISHQSFNYKGEMQGIRKDLVKGRKY